MGRRKVPKDKTPKYCQICGDRAKGVNFNALSCMSCKAFFRRQAFSKKEIPCPFNNNCHIDVITRKFCTKCRLRKCLEVGMKKEWILNEAEKQLIKQKKMTKFMIRRAKEASKSQPEPIPDSSSSSSVAETMPEVDQPESDSSSLAWSSLDDCFDQMFGAESSDLLFDEDLFSDLICSSTDSLSPDPSLLIEPAPHSSLETQILEQPQQPLTPAISSTPLLLELALPHSELIEPERLLIAELADACSLLQNPYQRIIDCANDYYYLGASNSQIFRTQYHFHRMIRMSKRLTSFRSLPLPVQVQMLKCSLLEMLNLQSILMYNSDRQSWRFIDDRCKSSVMVRMDLIKPFCVNFEAHQNMPKKFRDEWKRDNIIFDLLTAIVLFTPRSEYAELDRIKSEHSRYITLLQRYLTMKYSTTSEATECFHQLLSNISECSALVNDVKNFFRSFGAVLKDSPLFVQVFDLADDHQSSSSSSLMAIESSDVMMPDDDVDDYPGTTSLFELDLDSFDLF